MMGNTLAVMMGNTLTVMMESSILQVNLLFYMSMYFNKIDFLANEILKKTLKNTPFFSLYKHFNFKVMVENTILHVHMH